MRYAGESYKSSIEPKNKHYEIRILFYNWTSFLCFL